MVGHGPNRLPKTGAENEASRTLVDLVLINTRLSKEVLRQISKPTLVGHGGLDWIGFSSFCIWNSLLVVLE